MTRGGTWTIGLLVAAIVLAASAASASAAVFRTGGVAYASDNAKVKPHEFVRAKVACPKHTHVLGGGSFSKTTYGTIDLRQTYPVDLSDRDRKPDDGWGAAVYNRSKQKSHVIVIATCGKTAVKYVTTEFDLPSPGSNAEHDVDCPAPLYAYSGGVHSASKHIRLDSTFPYYTGQASTTWGTYFSTSKPTTADGYAVCLAPVPDVETANPPVTPSSEVGGKADCPPNLRVYGAGFATSAGGKYETINSLGPFPPVQPGTGGSALAQVDYGPINFSATMSVEATCGPKL